MGAPPFQGGGRKQTRASKRRWPTFSKVGEPMINKETPKT